MVTTRATSRVERLEAAPPPSGLRLGLLGDSIAWGQGAARPADRLGPRLAEALRARVEVEHRVFAVPGARSRDLSSQVDAALPWVPQLVLLVIGANDLTHREPVDAAVAALAEAVERLRAEGAEVVVAPAPDLGSVPHVPVFLREAVRAASDHLRRQQAAAVRAVGGHVADPEQRASLAFARDPALFSADRFHPSSAGYAVIADAVLPALLRAVEASRAREGACSDVTGSRLPPADRPPRARHDDQR